eukprot:756547-Hanusia_phi.AAC.8
MRDKKDEKAFRSSRSSSSVKQLSISSVMVFGSRESERESAHRRMRFMVLARTVGRGSASRWCRSDREDFFFILLLIESLNSCSPRWIP